MKDIFLWGDLKAEAEFLYNINLTFIVLTVPVSYFWMYPFFPLPLSTALGLIENVHTKNPHPLEVCSKDACFSCQSNHSLLFHLTFFFGSAHILQFCNMNKLFKGTMIKLTSRQGFLNCVNHAQTFSVCRHAPTVQMLAHRAQNMALMLTFVGIFISTPSDTNVSSLFFFLMQSMTSVLIPFSLCKCHLESERMIKVLWKYFQIFTW